MADTRFEIVIDADGKPAVKELGKVTTASKKAEKEVKVLGKSLSEIRSTAVNVAAASLVALGAAATVSIKAYAKFEKELVGVKTLLDESSFSTQSLEDGFAGMTKGVLDLAKKSPVAIASLNKSLFDTVSAGVSAGKAVEFLATASKLAVAGVTDVSIATDGLTSALNAYSFEADEADKIASKFFTAQKLGKTTVAELSNGFGLVGSSAKALGVSFNEVLASVSAMTLGGIATSQAYTGLKAILGNISAPSEKAAKAAKNLGIEFNAQALEAKGLSGLLKELASSENFTKQSVIELFGSLEAQKSVFSLLANEGESFSNVLNKLNDDQKTAKTFTDAETESMKTLANQMDIAGNNVDALAISLGEKLAPLLPPLIKELKNMVTWVDNNSESIAGFAKTMGSGITAVSKLTGVVSKIASYAFNNSSLGQLVIGMNDLGKVNSGGNIDSLVDSLADLNKEITKNEKEQFSLVSSGATTEEVNVVIDELKRLKTERSLIQAELNLEIIASNKKETDAIVSAAKEKNDKLLALEEENQAKLKALGGIGTGPEGNIEGDNNKKLELETTYLENLATLRASYKENDADKDATDLENLQQKLIDKKEIQDLAAVEELVAKEGHSAAIIAIEDLQLKATIARLKKEAVAKKKQQQLDRLIGAEKINIAKNTAALLIEILGRESKAAFLISKAVAVTDVIISDSKARASAMAVAASTATTAGPGAPALFATTLATLNGLISVNTGIQLATIAASTVQGFASGGMVDTVPAMLSPGEVVIPPKTSFADIVAAGRAVSDDEGGESSMNVTIGFTDDAFEIIESKLIERQVIGVA